MPFESRPRSWGVGWWGHPRSSFLQGRRILEALEPIMKPAQPADNTATSSLAALLPIGSKFLNPHAALLVPSPDYIAWAATSDIQRIRNHSTSRAYPTDEDLSTDRLLVVIIASCPRFLVFHSVAHILWRDLGQCKLLTSSIASPASYSYAGQSLTGVN